MPLLPTYIVSAGSVGLGNVTNTADADKPVSTAQQAALDAKKCIYKFTYDFPVNGGAAGTIALTAANGALPNKFDIQNVEVDVITPLGSAGAATAALTTGQTANDLVVAAAFDGAPWSAAGLKATLAILGTIASHIKTTAARSPAIVIAGANLNAGKFHVFVEGFQST